MTPDDALNEIARLIGPGSIVSDKQIRDRIYRVLVQAGVIKVDGVSVPRTVPRALKP